MGMVKKIGINGYALVDVLSNESEEEDDEPEDTSDIQATPPPKGESMDIEATTVAQGAPSELDSLSTQAHNHLVRLKVVVATVLANQALIPVRLDDIQLILDEDVASIQQ